MCINYHAQTISCTVAIMYIYVLQKVKYPYLYPCIIFAGKKEVGFPSMTEFLAWKEKVEEITNTSYVKTQQTQN